MKKPSDAASYWERSGIRLCNLASDSARTSADHFSHDEREHVDGWRASFNPVVCHAVDSQTLLEVGQQIEFVDARGSLEQPTDRSREVSLTIGRWSITRILVGPIGAINP